MQDEALVEVPIIDREPSKTNSRRCRQVSAMNEEEPMNESN